ncbi:Ubiquitin-conjugating enzyme 25 [Heracleum sosnowskyi]|uniref:RING-type E3 ubiquitin transferase n=1 Tax=Heracleum sosnowskyi TaxID=360622 RepID=A0AAD8JJ01_9APIA|nr:Ubiquitin-conjugating enzyme 25 [Heracleum sosnowskyi]
MLRFCQFAWPHTCIFVLLILFKFTVSTSKISISYSKQCASVVPEATPTTYADFASPYLQTATTYFTGGERIFGENSTHISYTSLYFQTSRNVYATNSHGVYKIDAELTFSVHSIEMHYPVSNSTHGRSSRRPRGSGRLKFLLHGFWSESSGKGCFVGSAPWYSSIGEPLNLEAMFKINYSKSSTYSNGFVNGELQSLSHLNDEAYFEPIYILSFPQVNQYEYKLISEEIVKSLYVLDYFRKSSVLGSRPGEICSLFDRNHYTFTLEYASSCSSSLKDCSPLSGVLTYRPTYVSLYSIQCDEYGNKMRFLVHLTNRNNGGRDEKFDPSATLVGEGLWDEKTNSLVIVACRISSSNSFGDAHVGDCSLRLSLYYPSTWSIKNRDKAVGQIWTNKTAQDVGYFGMIKFRTSDVDMKVPGFKYKYTEIENVNKLCPKKAVTRGKRYPRSNESFLYSSLFLSNSGWGGSGEIVKSEDEFGNVVSENVPVNVSFKLSFWSKSNNVKLEAGHSSLNISLNSNGHLVISAEGVYDARTGYLCMVGCRNLGSNNSLDCEILLNFQFPESIRTEGGFFKGSMQSTRKQSDPHFFQHLNVSSSAFLSYEAHRSLWRIDLEITMVLISTTNACIFVCFQLYHVKRYPNTVPYMSLVMLAILTLGHMVPLVLNFEAVFMAKQNTENVILTWTARRTGKSNEPGISVAEKKTLLVSLPIYAVSGLVAFLWNWKKNYYGRAPCAFDYSQAQCQQYTLWGNFRSYAGLILDGFLLPQVLLNIFQMSRRSALSMPFYLGTTLVHIVPHAYDLYRANNYVPAHVKDAYLYADPSADYYSATWDIIIPLAGLLLVVIIFLQQRYGGRIILPRKFREVELYAKVPLVT